MSIYFHAFHEFAIDILARIVDLCCSEMQFTLAKFIWLEIGDVVDFFFI